VILVTGWTGNTGGLVVQNLRRRFPERTIVGVARSAGAPTVTNQIVETADLAREREVAALFRRYSFRSIVHVANIRYSPLLMRLAEAHRIERVVLVHTAALHSRYQEYRDLYESIEGAILGSAYAHTAYTILRPTLIYGNHRDHNLHKLIRALARWPVFPVFGGGSARMQPIHVEDLATAIVRCVDNPKVVNRAYDLSGGSVVTYREMLGMIAAELGRRVVFVPVPQGLAEGLAALYSRVARNPRITVEQVRRLREDKSCPHEAATEDLDFRPRPFAEGLRQEIEELRREGLI
jgi:nucleoside-diphosphate-sugar epimerase